MSDALDRRAVKDAATVKVQPMSKIKGEVIEDGDPSTLTRRVFIDEADRIQSEAGFDELVAAGCNPVKAFRLWLSTDPGGERWRQIRSLERGLNSDPYSR